jgi:hypothetical protein
MQVLAALKQVSAELDAAQRHYLAFKQYGEAGERWAGNTPTKYTHTLHAQHIYSTIILGTVISTRRGLPQHLLNCTPRVRARAITTAPGGECCSLSSSNTSLVLERFKHRHAYTLFHAVC